MLREIIVYISNRLNLPVKYGSDFFSQDWFENWTVLKDVLKEIIYEFPEWRSFLDFGCGPGIMVKEFENTRLDYIGCDYSEDAKALYLNKLGGNGSLYKNNLHQINGRDFDVLLSFDVFEHMTDSEIEEVLNRLDGIKFLFLNISRSRFVPGHINLKSDRKWIQFFERNAFLFDAVRTQVARSKYASLKPDKADLWDQNLFIFKRSDLECH